jgi:hypothetical protein
LILYFSAFCHGSNFRAIGVSHCRKLKGDRNSNGTLLMQTKHLMQALV